MKTLKAQQRCITAGDMLEGVLDLGSQELLTHAGSSLEGQVLDSNQSSSSQEHILERPQGQDKGSNC